MDWGSVVGLVLALTGIIVGQAIEGGEIGSLVQPAAFVIVVIGTLGAVILQSGLLNFFEGVKLASWVFAPPPSNGKTLRRDVVNWSTTARREGLLSLERQLDQVRDPYLAKGLRLTVDGVDPFKLREILDVEIAAYETERKPVVESTQRAAPASLEWFEHLEQSTHQEPMQFAFNILTRSRRVTHDNLRLRDPEFVKTLELQGAIPAPMSPQEFAAFRDSESAKFAGIIHDTGITVNE